MIVKNDMKKVTLLIPVYNEEAMLPTLYQRLIELVNRNAVYEWEILFVNDGSSDTTLECLRRLRQQDKRVNYVNLSRNFGKEVAMLAGFDYATGDCCVVMDADLQDPPELVDQMLEYWEEGYDDIYAKRRTRGEESWLRRQFSLAFYGILQRMSRIDILPNVGDFRLLDRRCVLTLRRLRECERYTKGLFCWIGYQKKSIEFDRGDRLMGHSSWNFLKLLNLAVEGITSFSIAPLRIATVCGVLCSISSFIYAIYFLIKTVLYGDETAGKIIIQQQYPFFRAQGFPGLVNGISIGGGKGRADHRRIRQAFPHIPGKQGAVAPAPADNNGEAGRVKALSHDGPGVPYADQGLPTVRHG